MSSIIAAKALVLEPHATGPGIAEYIDEERRLAPEYGGRTIFGWSRDTSS